MPVQQAVALLAKQLDLECNVVDGVVRITPSATRPKLTAVTYSVADLVVTDNPAINANAALHIGTKVPTPRPQPTCEAKLIELITSTIKPQSWSKCGGAGTIEYFPLGRSLVIHQSADVQEQVAELLEALRRQNEVKVEVQTRIVAMSASAWNRLKNEPLLEGKGTLADLMAGHVFSGRCTPMPYPGLLMADGQLFDFLKSLQSDRFSNAMQMPSVALFDGQECHFDFTEHMYFPAGEEQIEKGDEKLHIQKMKALRVGTHGSICPVVSADRKGVQLKFDYTAATLSPQTASALFDHCSGSWFGEGTRPLQPVSFQPGHVKPELCTVALKRNSTYPAARRPCSSSAAPSARHTPRLAHQSSAISLASAGWSTRSNGAAKRRSC
jgi:hypothetical protein